MTCWHTRLSGASLKSEWQTVCPPSMSCRFVAVLVVPDLRCCCAECGFPRTLIATSELFEALQLEVENFAPEPQPSDGANMSVVAHVSALGPIRFDAHPCVRAQCGAPLLLCTSAGLFAVQPQKADFYHQLKWVFDKCRRPDQPAVICLSCFGEKLDDVAAFPPVAFVAGSAADIFFHRPRLDETHVQACQVEDAYPRLRFQVPAAYAQNWWVQMPYHLFECLGWTAEVADPPRSTADHMQVDLLPASETPLMPPAGLKLYLRELLFQSQLLALPKDARELLVGPFQIQVDARSVCTVSLPQQTTISTIERLWKNACDMVGTWPVAEFSRVPTACSGRLCCYSAACAESPHKV